MREDVVSYAVGPPVDEHRSIRVECAEAAAADICSLTTSASSQAPMSWVLHSQSPLAQEQDLYPSRLPMLCFREFTER
jgi:hypothetical protein